MWGICSSEGGGDAPFVIAALASPPADRRASCAREHRGVMPSRFSGSGFPSAAVAARRQDYARGSLPQPAAQAKLTARRKHRAGRGFNFAGRPRAGARIGFARGLSAKLKSAAGIQMLRNRPRFRLSGRPQAKPIPPFRRIAGGNSERSFERVSPAAPRIPSVSRRWEGVPEAPRRSPPRVPGSFGEPAYRQRRSSTPRREERDALRHRESGQEASRRRAEERIARRETLRIRGTAGQGP